MSDLLPLGRWFLPIVSILTLLILMLTIAPKETIGELKLLYRRRIIHRYVQGSNSSLLSVVFRLSCLAILSLAGLCFLVGLLSGNDKFLTGAMVVLVIWLFGGPCIKLFHQMTVFELAWDVRSSLSPGSESLPVACRLE